MPKKIKLNSKNWEQNVVKKKKVKIDWEKVWVEVDIDTSKILDDYLSLYQKQLIKKLVNREVERCQKY